MPLFTSLFNYRHNTGGTHESGRDTAFEGIATLYNWDRNNYPLNIAVNDTGTGFGFTVYAVAPADADVMCELLCTTTENLVAALENDPDAGMTALDVLGEAQRHRVLHEWNDTATPTVAELVPELFAAQVARTPDAVAVVDDGSELSYAELDARANRLARLLMARGVGPEQLVALAFERSAEMVVAVLAVLKAGAAYLPIDPSYPNDRIGFMLADSRAAVILGTEDILDELPAGRVHTVAVDDPTTAALVGADPSTRTRCARRTGLAGLRDLHVGIDGAAQGCCDHPRGLRQLRDMGRRCVRHGRHARRPTPLVTGLRPDRHQCVPAAGVRVRRDDQPAGRRAGPDRPGHRGQ